MQIWELNSGIQNPTNKKPDCIDYTLKKLYGRSPCLVLAFETPNLINISYRPSIHSTLSLTLNTLTDNQSDAFKTIYL